jgi:hypothetical protein
MTDLKLQFGNKTGFFHFLENIGVAQTAILDVQELNGVTPENNNALMALSQIVTQASRQLAEDSEVKNRS